MDISPVGGSPAPGVGEERGDKEMDKAKKRSASPGTSTSPTVVRKPLPSTAAPPPPATASNSSSKSSAIPTSALPSPAVPTFPLPSTSASLAKIKAEETLSLSKLPSPIDMTNVIVLASDDGGVVRLRGHTMPVRPPPPSALTSTDTLICAESPAVLVEPQSWRDVGDGRRRLDV